MAIQYPAYPVIPTPTNPLEMGLAGLRQGFQSARKGVEEQRGVDAFGKYLDATAGGIGSLTALGGGRSAAPGTAPAAGATTGGATPSKALTGDGGRIYSDFIASVKAGDPSLGLSGISNPYGLAAVASTGRAESGYSPGNIHRQWSDPSESGAPGNAGGIMSWRAERLANMRAFASKVGDDPNRPSAATQARFFLSEDPQLVARLNSAQSVEDAQQAINKAWAFAGWNRPGGEAARRTAMARSYYTNEFGRGGASAAIEAQAPQRPVEVASLEPGAGMDTALAYSPSGPSAEAGKAPRHVPIPTGRPEDMTYTTASPTAPANAAGATAEAFPQFTPPQRVAQALPDREVMMELFRNPDTRALAIDMAKRRLEGVAPTETFSTIERADGSVWQMNNLTGQLNRVADARSPERGVTVGNDIIDPTSGRVIYDGPEEAARPVEVGGALVDPSTGREIYRAPQARPKTQQEAEERAALADQYGLSGDEKRNFVLTGKLPSDGNGVTYTAPDGSVVQVGGAAKPLTEGQGKDAVYVTRATGALGILDQYAGALTDRGDRALGAVPMGIGRGYQNTEFQLAQQAGDEFLQAILRKDTGAAITEQEQSLYGTTYLPQPGDSPELLKQKQQSRTRAVEAIRSGMPPAAIVASELALRRTGAQANREQIVPGSDAGADATPEPAMPPGMDPAMWGVMTPEEKRLWQN